MGLGRTLLVVTEKALLWAVLGWFWSWLPWGSTESAELGLRVVCCWFEVASVLLGYGHCVVGIPFLFALPPR